MVLKEYWPRCLQELIEFQQIANAEQPEFEKVVSDVKSAADDFFLVSLSEYGCERWEKILGLSAEPGDTLQDRRDRILIKYLDQLPYTYRTLLKYLATVSEDFTVTLNENAYDLYIRIRLEGYAQRDALAATLGQMIPANLILRLRTDIPQDDQPAKTAACSAMAIASISRREPRKSKSPRRRSVSPKRKEEFEMFDPTQCESVSMAQAKAQEEQNPVNAALRATSIAFVTLAEAGQIDDTTATENVSQFAPWTYPVAYAVGNIRQYNGELFRCVQAHTSQADWTPDATASLWKKIGDPTEEWPAWSQPIGAHDAYNSGDKVSHNGKHWTSNIDANVWEPGVYGWTEVTK